MCSVLCYYRQKLFLFRNGLSRNFIFSPQLSRYFFPFSTTVTKNPPPQNPSFMVDYLINSCGFSRDKVITLSTHQTRIDSPKTPDSVISFLKECSLSDTQIKTMITRRPRLLSASVEKTLKPKVKVFQDLGMSGPDLAEIIVSRPDILQWSLDNHLLPSIGLLRTLTCSDYKTGKLLKSCVRLHYFYRWKSMVPNISLLQRCGLSDTTISKLILRHPKLLAQKPTWLEETVERVEKMGIDCGSRVFGDAIFAISLMSKSTLDAQFEMFKRFGWSETDILSSFRRVPDIVTISEIRFQRAMDFFLNVVGYQPSYVSLRPILLRSSLDKTIIPRHNVLQVLKSKNLPKGNHSLYTMAGCSEKKFLKNYVLPYKDKAPEEKCPAVRGTFDSSGFTSKSRQSPATTESFPNDFNVVGRRWPDIDGGGVDAGAAAFGDLARVIHKFGEI